MANILQVSDLRNYNEVLKNCRTGEPVFLTKNGRGRFVVLDIEDYERDRAEKKLLMKLQEAEEAVKDGEGWLSLDELKALVGEWTMLNLRINPLFAKVFMPWQILTLFDWIVVGRKSWLLEKQE
mgnify:CR=1 FL=1